jgi:hypothetical protein
MPCERGGVGTPRRRVNVSGLCPCRDRAINSTRANSGFVRAVRYSARTPARSNRTRLSVQLSGRNSRNAAERMRLLRTRRRNCLRLGQIEHYLGTSLFERGRSRYRLTPAVLRLVPRPVPACVRRGRGHGRQTPSSPTSTGFTQPNSAIDPAICATCSSEWVRALRAWGISRSSCHCSRLAENVGVTLILGCYAGVSSLGIARCASPSKGNVL